VSDVNQVVIGRLRAAGLNVWDTHVPDTATPDYPYVVVGSMPIRRERTTLAGGRASSLRLLVTLAGLSPEAVRIISKRVRDALEDWAPGWVGDTYWWEISQDYLGAQEVMRDKDFPLADGQPVFFALEYYHLTSG